MIKKVKKSLTKEQILDKLDPLIREWFNNNFSDMTPAQAQAIPLIHQRRNVLVASPTGSGKTLTAFLLILNQLIDLGQRGKLENQVYCIYISPLKALANDIERNLKEPLKQIYTLSNSHGHGNGLDLPEIRVGVRTGDTTTSERQRMTKKAPHILITTPESLSIILSTKRFRYKLLNTQFVIVDEIHDICNSKRGVHLSLLLERLQHQIYHEGCGEEFTRIGLSATQAPIKEIAKFLGGYTKENKLREMNIVDVDMRNDLDLRVLCPVQDMNQTPFEIINEKMYDILFSLINDHRTTLIFTNTRSGAETVTYKLREGGVDNIATHHGSLGKDTRLDVERKLKNGELKATISSTSLELGIDIGYIDMVCQIGSPKSIAKGLQRIGRSGHALHEISKGRIIVFDRDDLVECAVLVKNAYAGNIDRINILHDNLDVLAQTLIGMSLEHRWELESAYQLIKQSYCYHKLPKNKFMSVMKYIGGKHELEDRGIYGKVRYYPEDSVFGIRRGARTIYNLNIGTIPQEANYRVVLLGTGRTIGTLSEKFVGHLTKKDIIILGGKTYEYVQTKGTRVYVRDAQGKKPTVPSWSGEMLPRSFDLAREIGKFRAELGKRLAESKTKVETWLRKEYYLDPGSARSIINYFIEQKEMIEHLPGNKNVVIEGYIDTRGNFNIIFHYCFGRRVNDTLSRTYAYELSKIYRCTVKISITDDNFMITLPKRVELYGLEKIVEHGKLKDTLIKAIKNTELFKQRFRHCAVRSFMVLRNYKGREIAIRKQLKQSQKMFELLQKDSLETDPNDFPVIYESYNEIFNSVLDFKHAFEIQRALDLDEISVKYSNYSKIPSPFAHNVVLTGISDIILMEDRSTLLRELHQQVLEKVFKTLERTKPKFKYDLVKKYYEQKIPVIRNKKDILHILRKIGPMHLFSERGRNIFDHLALGSNINNAQDWAKELVDEKKVISIIRKNNRIWIPRDHYDYYVSVYRDTSKITRQEQLVLKWLSSFKEQGIELPRHQGSGPKTQLGLNIEPPISIKELNNTLHALEKCLMVHRTYEDTYEGRDGVRDGAVTWFVIEENNDQHTSEQLEKGDELDQDSALRFLVVQYLQFNGPKPINEISYELNQPEERIARCLNELEEIGQIAVGNYIFGQRSPQYIIKKDLTKLDQMIEEPAAGPAVFDLNTVQSYLIEKIFGQVDRIQDYFNKFGLSFGLREMYIRTKNFDLRDWIKLTTGKGRKLVYGRFLSGRLCYVPATDISLYASAYREAELDNKELTVLNLIKKHRGITKRELSKKLDARQKDLSDIIDKLERNLYIIREIPKRRSHGIAGDANRYVFYNLRSPEPNCYYEIIKKILNSFGPLNEFELINYTGFTKKTIDQCIGSLEATGELKRFRIEGEGDIEYFISNNEFELLQGVKEQNISNKNERTAVSEYKELQILSQSDNYTLRYNKELRLKFGEGWYSIIIFYGRIVGMIDLWRLSSCVEIKDIRFDDDLLAEAMRYLPDDMKKKYGSLRSQKNIKNIKSKLLKRSFMKLNELMGFYLLQDLDVLRLRNLFGDDLKNASTDVKDVLRSSGFIRVQGFYVKGNLKTNVFNERQIVKLILQKQHVLPESRFVNPLTAIKTMGGIRSNFEMFLRLDGNFYDIKEFRKNLNLAAGPIIPENYTYCTEKDLRIYKTAKGRKLDYYMKYILENMPDSEAISSKNMFARITLSKDQYTAARKRLYEGLYIIRDPMNKYYKVGDYRNLTKSYARKYVIKRLLRNFGIFSAEGLAALTKGEYSMMELRGILRELEADNDAVKGYFIKGDENLYWMNKKDLKKIKEFNIQEYETECYVISPQDQLSNYFSPIVRNKFGISSCFFVIQNYELVSAFKIIRKKKRVVITEYIGPEEIMPNIENFFRKHKMEVVDEEAEELYTYNDKF